MCNKSRDCIERRFEYLAFLIFKEKCTEVAMSREM